MARDNLTGEIIEIGEAPYQHKERNKLSPFVRLRVSKGVEREVWGVDIPNALADANAKVGDYISLSRGPREPVTVDGVLVDEQGKEIGQGKVKAEKQYWKASVIKRPEREQKEADEATRPAKRSTRSKAAKSERARKSIEKPVESELASAAPVETKPASFAMGELVRTGQAPYLDQPGQKKSFYAEVAREDGTSVKVWGVGVKVALQQSDARKGDYVVLEESATDPGRWSSEVAMRKETALVIDPSELGKETSSTFGRPGERLKIDGRNDPAAGWQYDLIVQQGSRRVATVRGLNLDALKSLVPEAVVVAVADARTDALRKGESAFSIRHRVVTAEQQHSQSAQSDSSTSTPVQSEERPTENAVQLDEAGRAIRIDDEVRARIAMLRSAMAESVIESNEAADARPTPIPATAPTLASREPLELERRAGEPDTRTIPPEVLRQYVLAGSTLYDRNNDRYKIVDRGRSLSTSLDNERAASAMVSIAVARRWEAIKVSGTQEFKRAVWLEASLAGLQVKGYKPNERDMAILKEQKAKLNTIKRSDAVQRQSDPAQEPGRKSVGNNATKAAAAAALAHVRETGEFKNPRAKAFMHDDRQSAIKEFPELKDAYLSLFLYRAKKEAEYPNHPDVVKRFVQTQRTQIALLLEAGKEPPKIMHTKEVERLKGDSAKKSTAAEKPHLREKPAQSVER